jgi:hypothetical protein
MKKSLVCLAAAMFLLQGVKAQDNERAVVKGQSSVNIYYGYRLSNAVLRAFVDDNALNQRFKSMGPVGLVYEFMLSDVVGLGAEFGYGSQSVSWDYTTLNSNFETVTYTETLKITNLRIMARANFHFIKTPNFDMYGLVSVGYRNNAYTWTDTNPNAVNESFDGVVPFGLKPGIGFRYFFGGPIGLHLELAAGTPAVAGGLSFRF